MAGRIDSAQRAIDLFTMPRLPESAWPGQGTRRTQSQTPNSAKRRRRRGPQSVIKRALKFSSRTIAIGTTAWWVRLPAGLSEELNIPVILGGYAAELGSYAFSGRSRGGVHLHETLKKALSGVKGEFRRSQGGHRDEDPEDQVARITDILRERSNLIIPEPARLSREYAAQLRPSSIQIAHWKEVNSLEPYGPDNEPPTFMVRDAELELSGAAPIGLMTRTDVGKRQR